MAYELLQPLDEPMGFSEFLFECAKFLRFTPPLKRFVESVHVCEAGDEQAIGEYFTAIHGLTPT